MERDRRMRERARARDFQEGNQISGIHPRRQHVYGHPYKPFLERIQLITIIDLFYPPAPTIVIAMLSSETFVPPTRKLSMTPSRSPNVARFDAHAQAYLSSAVHADGPELGAL